MPNPNVTVTPNMALPVPNPTDPGPDYANNVNTSLNAIDAHTHSGPPAGGALIRLDQQLVEADVSLDDHNLTNARSVEFQSQPSQLTGSQDVNCVYVNQNNLGFNNSNGIFVQITSGNNLNIAFQELQNWGPQSVTANYTILPTAVFNLLAVDSTGGALTITLPVAAAITPTAVGRLFLFKDTSGAASSHAITIQVAVASGNTFEGGSTSLTIDTQFGYTCIFTDGVSKWFAWSQNTYNAGQVLNVLPGAFIAVEGTETFIGGTLEMDSASSVAFSNTIVAGTVNANLNVSAGQIQTTAGGVITGNVAGGITAGVGGGIASGIQGGIHLTGGANDWLTFPARTKIVCFPLQPIGWGTVSYGVLNNDASSLPNGAIGWNAADFGFTTKNGGAGFSGPQQFALPVMHQGAILNEIGVTWATNTHSALPASQPTIRVQRMQLGNNNNPGSIFVDLSTSSVQSFGAANVTAYNNSGLTNVLSYVCNQNNAIDSTQYCYFLTITDEHGSNSMDSNIWFAVALGYGPITVQNFVT
jgi:hypothetical protein